MVGTEQTRLVVLRGNSASGKSSVAAGLREEFGRGHAVERGAQVVKQSWRLLVPFLTRLAQESDGSE